MSTLTAERLREIIVYDPVTGVFRNRVKRSPRAIQGIVIGNLTNKGYLNAGIDGKTYSLHRLAWLYMTGEFPTLGIDHKDTIKTNNAWENLREANGSQNEANKSITNKNKTGVKGVYWNAVLNKYHAQIRINRKTKHLGYYQTIQEAAAAYKAAAILTFGEYARY